jgi:hypothetical protein
MFCPIRKIIFTHPPKCGGTSFEHFLGFKNYGEHCRLYKHASLVDHVKAIEKINQNADDFAKISIIRNPWERMVSWYFHLREKALFAERFGKLKNRIQSLASDLEFNEFVDCINKFNIEIFHRDFSYYMFGESNTFEIDFVIRYENYKTDFLKCLEILKIPPISTNLIPVKNQGLIRSLDYKKYYGRESKEIVTKIYSKDINFFNFTF